MAGDEDSVGNPRASSQPLSTRRTFWRSASWSASRTSAQNPESEERHSADPGGNISNNSSHSHRYPGAPLTPRSQHNCKARACLPPLQPLSISRRSLDDWPKAGSDDLGEWPHPPTPSGNKNGERLKLDLSSIQRKPEKNSGKRDKIASFDKECSKVAEHIYLGGDAVARDRDILKQNGITHILNCVGYVCPEYFKSDFVYRTLWLQDSPSEDITSILYDVFDYFEDVREQCGRIFVHCCQGVSRSTSLVIAYLMWSEGQSFDDAFEFVKAARGIADPNMGFACQLLQCQKRFHAFPLSPTSLIRMFRISPHSPYDPLHLVPKMLNDPSPSALDSRGAFIIHIPSAIYIWIGRNCETVMERDARSAVCQMVQYEKVQVPIFMMNEGEEPASFWDAFRKLLPQMDRSAKRIEVCGLQVKVQPGERRVETYDVDFEIFQKAIRGGFVPPFGSSDNEHETQLPVRESSWSPLRRKFASRCSRNFISVRTKSLNRVYSDSMMIVHPSPSSSTSSSSSPLYASPDSVSSDSSASSKHLSESSIESPSNASFSLLLPSTLPHLSNLSLHTFHCSLTSSPENHNVNMPSQLYPKSSTTRKEVLPSLAERRGSMSKSLKLPALRESIENSGGSGCGSESGGQKDNARTKDSASTLLQPDCIEMVFDLGVGVRNEVIQDCKSDKSPSIEVNSTSCNIPASSGKHSERGTNCSLARAPDSDASNDYNNVIRDCELAHPLICHWPSMERLTAFSMRDLNSQSVFAIFFPSKDVSQTESRVLYLWTGKSYHPDRSRVQPDSSDRLGDAEHINWSQVGADVLTRLDLPKSTLVKIIREAEEPAEFLALLKSISQHC